MVFFTLNKNLEAMMIVNFKDQDPIYNVCQKLSIYLEIRGCVGVLIKSTYNKI